MLVLVLAILHVLGEGVLLGVPPADHCRIFCFRLCERTLRSCNCCGNEAKLGDSSARDRGLLLNRTPNDRREWVAVVVVVVARRRGTAEDGRAWDALVGWRLVVVACLWTADDGRVLEVEEVEVVVVRRRGTAEDGRRCRFLGRVVEGR